jgi:hypothetical protein
MSKSRLGPEAKIITLFTALPDDSKRIVFDVIRSQTATPRKVAAKKSKTASAPAQNDLPADKKSDVECIANVPTLDVPCGERADALIHDPKGGYASYHPFEPAKSVARAPRKSKPKDTHSLSVAIEKEKSAAVGSGGD